MACHQHADRGKAPRPNLACELSQVTQSLHANISVQPIATGSGKAAGTKWDEKPGREERERGQECATCTEQEWGVNHYQQAVPP